MHLNDIDVTQLYALEKELNRCPICRGRDMYCICRTVYRQSVNLIYSGMPTKYRRFELKDINHPKAQDVVAAVGKYIATIDAQRVAGEGLYLWGNPGTAKTVLACVTLKEAVKHNYSVYFTTVEEYRTALFDHDESLVDKINNSIFLLIDDIGREFQDAKGFITSKVDDLIRYRTDRLLPTIITSNLDEDNANQSRRFSSILKEHFTKIWFNFDDYRAGIDKEKTNAAIEEKTNASKTKKARKSK